jgi:hypothetical protein
MKINLLKNAQIDVAAQLGAMLDKEAYLTCRSIQTRHVQASLMRIRASIRAYQFLSTHAVGAARKQSFIKSLVAWVRKDLCC